MDTAIDQAERTPVLRSLTGLRWVAAFIVFAFHLRNVGGFSGVGQQILDGVFGAGATGVSLFFVLSGFVLAWGERPGLSPWRFWRNRIARIYPSHVVAFVIAMVLGATLVPGIATRDPLAALANLTLTSSWNTSWWQAGNPVSWSLVCEAFFYLMFPLLILLFRRLGRAALLVGAAVAVGLVIAGPLLVANLHVPISALSSPIMRLPEFVAGILLARLLRTGAWQGPRKSVAVTLAIAGYWAALQFPDSPLARSGFTIVGFSMLIAALARTDIAGRPTVLSTRTMITLGTLSFPFYLVHLLALQAVTSAWPGGMAGLPAQGSAAAAIVAFGVALGSAWLLHRFIELPGHRLIVGRLRRPAPVTAETDGGTAPPPASEPRPALATR